MKSQKNHPELAGWWAGLEPVVPTLPRLGRLLTAMGTPLHRLRKLRIVGRHTDLFVLRVCNHLADCFPGCGERGFVDFRNLPRLIDLLVKRDVSVELHGEELDTRLLVAVDLPALVALHIFRGRTFQAFYELEIVHFTDRRRNSAFDRRDVKEYVFEAALAEYEKAEATLIDVPVDSTDLERRHRRELLVLRRNALFQLLLAKLLVRYQVAHLVNGGDLPLAALRFVFEGGFDIFSHRFGFETRALDDAGMDENVATLIALHESVALLKWKNLTVAVIILAMILPFEELSLRHEM